MLVSARLMTDCASSLRMSYNSGNGRGHLSSPMGMVMLTLTLTLRTMGDHN
jgi:hypothetical protein